MKTLTLDDLNAAQRRHEIPEIANDLEGTMATVCPDPTYELPAVGWMIEGREAVYEFYRRTLPYFDARDVDAERRIHAAGPNTLLREAYMTVVLDGETVCTNYVAVMAIDPETGLITGERLYTDPVAAGLFAEALGDDFGTVPGVSKLPWREYAEKHPNGSAGDSRA